MRPETILERFPFYAESPPDFRRRLVQEGRTVRLDRGATYVCEGQTPEGIALVGEGRLRVFKTSLTGRAITLYEVGTGEVCILNLLSLMTGIASPASAEVEDPVTALYYPSALFRSWVGSESSLRSAVFAALAAGVAGVMSLVEEIAFKKLDSRLAAYLRQGFGAGGAPGTIQATHERIAGDLGSAREPISRLLKEFERQGAVDLGRGRITLRDSSILELLAG